MACALVFVSSLTALQSAAQPPIRLHLQTRDCRAPCTLNATVYVPTHADNRHVAVVWGYDDAASRDWTLGPGPQPEEFAVRISDLAAGQHTVHAVLLREHDGTQETFEDSQGVLVREAPAASMVH